MKRMIVLAMLGTGVAVTIGAMLSSLSATGQDRIELPGHRETTTVNVIEVPCRSTHERADPQPRLSSSGGRDRRISVRSGIAPFGAAPDSAKVASSPSGGRPSSAHPSSL